MGIITEEVDRSKVLAKIQKVLALTASDNESEAANAAELAQNLLFQYNISEDELNAFSSKKGEKVIEIKTAGKNEQRRSAWYGGLATVVATSNLCKLLTSGSGLIWIGKATNVELARFIFDSLVIQLTVMCERRWYIFNYEQRERGSGLVHGKTWKNNFYFGAIQAISERLTQNLVQLKHVDTTMALVVRNDIELDEFMQQNHPRTVKNASSFRYSRVAFDSGKQAGRSVQFRQGLGAGGSLGPKMLGTGNKRVQ